MRLAMPSAFVATAILGGLYGLSHAESKVELTTPTGVQTETISRHVLPSAYQSWYVQGQSLRVCKPLRDQEDENTKQWVSCLVGHYEAKTGYELSAHEYRANRKGNKWQVSYSRITIPGGGTRLTKAEKDELGLAPDVYYKRYKMSNGSLIIGSNGTSF